MLQQLLEFRSLCYSFRYSYEPVNGKMIVTKAKPLRYVDVSSIYGRIYGTQQDAIENSA
jgi:hypothetical protein